MQRKSAATLIFDDTDTDFTYDLPSKPAAAAPIVRYSQQHAMNMAFIEAGVQAQTTITPYLVAKYIVGVFLVCVGVSVAINFFQVAYTQYAVVQRYRDVAEAEMRQECCIIYDSSSDTAWPKQKIEDCMRILADDKMVRNINRCEAAKDIVGNVFTYQWILEIWGYYFPLSKTSFIDAIWVTIFGTGTGAMMNVMMMNLFKGFRKLYF